MNKIKLLLCGLLLVPAVSLAEMRIAVIDPLQAIFETADAKKRTGELESDIKSKEQEIGKLRDEIIAIEQRLKKDGMTMSQNEQKRLTDERDAKMLDFRSRTQLAQKRIEGEQQELLKVLEPKLKSALEALAKEKGYDLILNRQAALFVKEEVDITRAVTQKINQMK